MRWLHSSEMLYFLKSFKTQISQIYRENCNYDCRCPVMMRIVVLNGKPEAEFPTEVWVDCVHNHSLSSAHCLRELRVTEETNAEFILYFEQGKEAV